jgi:hypothetical protein
MNKRDKIDYLLSLIKEQTDEFLETELISSMNLSEEELITAAMEVVLRQSVMTIEYSMPIGKVDRDNVSFVIDKNIQIALTSSIEETEDDED